MHPQVAAVDGGGTQTRPYLTLNFSCRLGGVEHSLPVSWPYSPDEIDRLVEDKDVAALCPFYIDLAAAGPRLSATVDGMKHLGGVLRLTLCRTGDAHVQARGCCCLLWRCTPMLKPAFLFLHYVFCTVSQASFGTWQRSVRL